MVHPPPRMAWPCLCLLLGCAGSAPQPQAQTADGQGQPRLVIAVVFDQLGSDALARHLPLLDKDGAIRHAMAVGTVADGLRYSHASSYTAPDHAALFTGLPPRKTGVVGNAIRHPDEAIRAAVNDGQHPVFGAGEHHGGPGALQVPTVGDRLKARAGAQAKVVSISVKDRAAILPGGHHPDAAIWFDAGIPAFTTSSYYGDAVPAWAQAFQAAHPLSDLLTPWQPQDPQALAAHLGPDNAPGEGHFLGLDASFPHDPRAATKPYAALRMMPALSEYLIALAEHAVVENQLGEDAVPDLLCLSISGTDYAGHVYGPDSWEYVDHLRRADLALGRMLARLAERTEVAVLITSDHGVAQLPERDPEHGFRVPRETILATANHAIEALSLGAPDVRAQAFVEPYVYLTKAAREHARYGEIAAAVAQAVGGMAHVHAAFASGALTATGGENELERDVSRAIHPVVSGDVYVVPARATMADLSFLPGAGTTHGSPWDYDRQVPAMAFGRGVPHGPARSAISEAQFAGTLAHLLGIPMQPDESTIW